jgi:hypothetical protein
LLLAFLVAAAAAVAVTSLVDAIGIVATALAVVGQRKQEEICGKNVKDCQRAVLENKAYFILVIELFWNKYCGKEQVSDALQS